MPAPDTALELITAYRLKRARNPLADRATLYKYLLWDRFSGRMVLDAELDEMARDAGNLLELTLRVIGREKPGLAAGSLRQPLERELRRFFELNAPDLL